ncbi:MAG TPA: alpha/beta hydrolase [Steroidobacteraceae bacterium]|jgi:pimeloyl-ACP methyl ester carboxylesterase|nr:alpha/beta hydrolase [Steroidobacteraceae bacterium]
MPKGPATSASPVVPRVRRGYFESRYGQLHVHNAIPPGGGFDEGTSLLCLHATPRSGSSMLPLLSLMGMDRSVYAPDLPGYGNSDAPTARPSIADYANVIGDFCTTMRFRHLDVLGYQAGALVAAELAMALPAVVRRVVLVGVPVPDDAERDSFRRAPWPVAPSADGAHLLVEWNRTRNAVHEGAALESIASGFADKLANGPLAWWGMQAAMQYPAAERLRLITQPTLLIRSREGRGLDSARARELLPKARSVEQAQVYGSDLFESAATELSSVLREFLRG